jgi:hypothetical protein
MRTSHGTDNLCSIRASVVSDGVCGDDTTSSIRTTVRVLSHSRILDLMGVSSNLFLYPPVEAAPDLYITGFRCGFYFLPMGCIRNLKTPKSEKYPNRNLKILKETHLQNLIGN